MILIKPPNSHNKSIYCSIYLLFLNVLLIVIALEFDVVHNFYYTRLRRLLLLICVHNIWI